MTAALQNSVLYRWLLTLWAALIGWLSNSGLARLYYGVEGLILRWVKGSAVCTFLARPGRLTGAWEGSFTCRAVEWLLNLVPSLLHRLYAPLRPVWEGSLVFRGVTFLGENIPLLLSWFFLLMAMFPHTYWNNAFSLGFGILGVILCYAAAMRRPALRLIGAVFGPYLWAFFFLLCAGVLKAGVFMTSLRYFTYFFSAILLALLTVSTVTHKGQLKRMAAFASAGIPVATAYALYQRFIVGIKNTSSTVDMELNANMPGRVFSFFENPNTFAQVLVMLIPLALGLMFSSRSFRGKVCAAIAAGCGVLSIVMTYSRASWIGLVVAIFLFVLLVERRLIPVLIVGAVALLPFLPASIYNRILTIFDPSDSSTSSRFPIFEVGFKLWKLHPVTGVGLGSELSASLAHNSGWYHRLFKFPHYHNIYIQLAVELGTLGVVSYTAGFFSGCKETVRALLSPGCDKETRSLIAGCLSGLVGVMVCGLADYFWHYPRVMAIFWLIFGMMLCGIKLVKKEQA